jgi:SAM-dependent methyltransferase
MQSRPRRGCINLSRGEAGMMPNWAEGYVTDAIYTDGFYRELSPAWINYVAALKGCLPVPLDRPFTFLELGCGLGRSTAILAGAFLQGRFIGIDFNPAHIALARQYASDLRIANAEFLEASFQDATSLELPQCDFIVLHGVYTWISAEARAAARHIIRDRLRAGGFVYVSYNCLPGWSSAAPLRKLLYEAASEHAGPIGGNVAPALKVMEDMVKANLGFFRANEDVAGEVKSFRDRGVNYLAHEYLNADWSLFYSVDVADEMAEAKLTYVGSATLPENHLDLMVDDKIAATIEARPTARMRQLLLDFAINQRFRRDIFVRGHQRLQGPVQRDTITHIPFATLKADAEFVAKIRVGRGEIAFHEQLFPILKEAFKGGIHTIEELNRLAADALGRAANTDRTTLMMVAAGHIMPCASSHVTKDAAAPSEKVKVSGDSNRAALALALKHGTRQVFVSRLAGTGIPCEPLDAILIDLLSRTESDSGGLQEPLCAAMKKHGLRMMRDGEPVKDAAEEHTVADEFIERFLADRLPVFIRLGIIEAARQPAKRVQERAGVRVEA